MPDPNGNAPCPECVYRDATDAEFAPHGHHRVLVEACARHRDTAPTVASVLTGLRDLHQPMMEVAEFEWDEDDGRSPHCNDLCRSARQCPGHTVEVPVCRECGYEHDDGLPVFRSWPCPTARLVEQLGQVVQDQMVRKLTERYADGR